MGKPYRSTGVLSAAGGGMGWIKWFVDQEEVFGVIWLLFDGSRCVGIKYEIF